MKRKLPAFRRVPVDFGNEEPLCAVPVHESRFPAACARRSGRFNVSTFQRFNALSNHKSQRQVALPLANRKLNAFTLVEILVVLVLLSMIVLALMAVFSGIQRAFRASLTQTDTLEGGRAVMDMIANDLTTMAPANWQTNLSLPFPGNNNPSPNYYAPINFYVALQTFASPNPPTPLVQPLLSSPTSQARTDILENIFILSKGNINGVPSWVGTGYSVTNSLADGTLYPLYRFYMTTNASAGPAGQAALFNQFAALQYTNGGEWSHMMDGVVSLTAQVYDTNGVVMTNGYTDPQDMHVRFARFLPNFYGPGFNTYGATECIFYSNALPASVQIELGTMEDRTLSHAQSLGGANQSNYLSNAVGQVHIFRQRVWIPNVDLTAYQ